MDKVVRCDHSNESSSALIFMYSGIYVPYGNFGPSWELKGKSSPKFLQLLLFIPRHKRIILPDNIPWNRSVALSI